MRTLSLFLIGYILFMVLQISACSNRKTSGRPNIIFAISDDQGYPYAGAYGTRFVNTPGFDRVAEEGLLFNNVYCAVPQCSPNRASILTGRYLWQNAEAGTHASLFPAHLRIFTDLLIGGGYEMASTGKTWGPGVIRPGSQKMNISASSGKKGPCCIDLSVLPMINLSPLVQKSKNI